MGKSYDVAATVAEKPVAGKKFKIKILAKKPANGVGHIMEQVAEVNCMERSSLTDDRMPNTAASRKVHSDVLKKPGNGGSQFSKVNCLEKSFPIDNQMTRASDNENHKTTIGIKRGSEGVLECRQEKRLKMDRIAASRCQSILLKLMSHKFGVAFLEPVDPSLWSLPDYFKIIKHPMDLGTIRRKLLQNTYNSVEEFEADVRLTFSNAMLYNPSNNWAHQHAKELSKFFDCHWKSVKALLIRDHKNIMKKRIENGPEKISCGVIDKRLERNSCHVDAAPKNIMLHKGNSAEDLKELSVDLRWRDLQAVKDPDANASKQLRPCPDSVGPVSLRCKESACTMSTNGPREQKNGFKVINTSTVQMSRSDQDSDGAVSCLDEELAGASTIPATAGSSCSITQSLETVLDIELSPSKALRAAKLRSRFADTILKAQNKTLLQPVGRKDAVMLEQEKVRLLKKQQEEKARIEAQVRDAELAARLKAEGELKKQREQARDAARAALEKMERSIDLDDNFHTLRDLETLMGSSLFMVCPDSRPCRVWNEMESNKLGSPLERLGLYMKAEYKVGDDDDDILLSGTDLEEGEVPL